MSQIECLETVTGHIIQPDPMKRGKAMKKTLLLLVIMLFWFLPTAQAEVKTFVHTVRQPFSGSQSPDDARVAAIHKAKREVLEKAGTYLETLTIVEKGRLTKEQIVALASGVLKTEIISQKPYTTGEGYGVIVKVRVRIDTGQVEQNLKRLMNDKPAMKQLVELRKRDKELLERIERLEEMNRGLSKKKETQAVKQIRKELKKDFQQTTKGLDAVALRDQTSELWKDGKYSNPRRAIELLDKAIKLDPGYARAYCHRGNAYADLKQYERAIQDFDKAIKLDPGYAWAYGIRGLAYADLNQHERAIQDLDKAIQLDPNFAASYGIRGLAYADLHQYAKAIQDFDKAIKLDPGYARAYYNRGIVYRNLNQPIKAIQDFDKAIELNPGDADAYYYRGLAYVTLKEYVRAIQEYNKAIELDPSNAGAYDNRGLAYIVLQRDAKGCADLKKACELGECGGWKIAIKENQ